MWAELALKLHAGRKRNERAVQVHRKSSIVLNLKRPPLAGADRVAYSAFRKYVGAGYRSGG